MTNLWHFTSAFSKLKHNCELLQNVFLTSLAPEVFTITVKTAQQQLLGLAYFVCCSLLSMQNCCCLTLALYAEPTDWIVPDNLVCICVCSKAYSKQMAEVEPSLVAVDSFIAAAVRMVFVNRDLTLMFGLLIIPKPQGPNFVWFLEEKSVQFGGSC